MRMRPIFLLTVLAFLGSAAHAQFPAEMQHALEMKRVYPTDVAGDDFAAGAATDAAGNTYVTGYTMGTFSGQTALGDNDCFLAKYDTNGTLVWARQFGTSAMDICMDVAVDANATPIVYVTGYTAGTFAGQTSAGGIDVFLVEYNSSTGAQTFVVQKGTSKADYAYKVVVDSSDRPYVAGSTRGAFTGFTNAGGLDAFLFSLKANGTDRWEQQWGTVKDEEVLGMAIDSSSRVFVTGYTQGTFSGQTNAGRVDAFAARYSAAGAQSWLRQFGTSAVDVGLGISVVASSGISNVVGSTDGTFPGQANYGGHDYFVSRFALNGSPSWTAQGGTSGDDIAIGTVCDSSGNISVNGLTYGAFSGYTNAGGTDVFIAEHTTTGTLSWRRQIGTTADDILVGMSINSSAITFSVGATMGGYSGQTNLGAEDAVIVKYSASGTQTWLRQFGTN